MVLRWIEGILSGAPAWVWPPLVLLLFLGYRASRSRRIPIAVYYFMPLLGLISINSLLVLPNQSMTWLGYAAGYATGFFMAYRLQSRWLIAKDQRMISVAGEWFTLLTFMVIYWMNFASGMTKAVSTQTYTSPGFSLVYALVVGWAGGTFLGRTLYIVVAPNTVSDD